MPRVKGVIKRKSKNTKEKNRLRIASANTARRVFQRKRIGSLKQAIKYGDGFFVIKLPQGKKLNNNSIDNASTVVRDAGHSIFNDVIIPKELPSVEYQRLSVSGAGNLVDKLCKSRSRFKPKFSAILKYVNDIVVEAFPRLRRGEESLILTQQHTPEQHIHIDIPYDSKYQNFLANAVVNPTVDVPLSILVATQEGSSILLWPHGWAELPGLHKDGECNHIQGIKVVIPANSVLVFRADLPHAGASGGGDDGSPGGNLRFHVFYEPTSGFERELNTTGDLEEVNGLYRNFFLRN